MSVTIANSCIGCGACIPTCPFKALEIDGEGIVAVISEKCVDCGKCVPVCPVEAVSLPPDSKVARALAKKKEKEAAVPSVKPKDMPATETIKPVDVRKIHTASEAPPELADYTGGVWVFAEHLEGKVAGVTLELIGVGKELAQKLNVPVSAILIGDRVEHVVPFLYENGADKVYLMEDTVFHYYRAETYMKGFCQLVRKYKPEILLMGATTTGRDLAGAVATELRTGLTADCTNLDIDLEKRILLASRPAFGGNIMATILCEIHRPQMATVRPRVMKRPVPVPCRKGELIRESIKINEKDLCTKVLEIVMNHGEKVKLDEAQIIVSGGRGMQDISGFNMLKELAKVLDGVVGGSRGAVEAGWIDHKRQVGQTGITVAPKLYIAVGISGAIQHVVGMQGAETIVAINNDPNCEMIKLANFSIVGDAFEIVPKLVEEFKQALKTIPEEGIDYLCPDLKGESKVG